MKKKEDGITLIALVITIIVLLILAGVSIMMVVGDNGILNQADKAKRKTRISQIEELKNIWFGEREISKTIGEEPKTLESFLEELKNNGYLSDDEINQILEDENNELIIDNITISFKVDEINVVEPDNIEDWEYIINEDNTITITLYKGNDTVVVFPNYIGGLPVKSIIGRNGGDDRYGNSIWGYDLCVSYQGYPGIIQNTITKVVISEGIENIDTKVFWRSIALVNIELPNSLKNIGDYAFGYCTSLKSIILPKNIESIGKYIFTNIPSITVNVKYDEDEIPTTWNSDWDASNDGVVIVNYGYKKPEVVEPDNIEDWEYTVNNDETITITSYKGSDTTVVIPNYIGGIPVKVVSGNGSYLQKRLWDNSICISSSVYGGYEQNTITKVIVSEGIEEIQTLGFCTSLTEVVLPNTLKVIGDYTFAECQSLSEITIPNSVDTLGSTQFYNISEITVNVPYTEGNLPTTWDSGWQGSTNVTIKYAE